MKKKIIDVLIDIFDSFSGNTFRNYQEPANVGTPGSGTSGTEKPEAAPPEKPALSSYDKWWQVKNAEYYRDQCWCYLNALIQKPGDYDRIFGKVPPMFWHSCGSVILKKTYPEIQTLFLTVEVYGLRDTWNKRDVDLKQALLTELRKALIDYAKSKGYDLTAWFSVVVAGVWKVGNKLVFEVPCSPFPFLYPELARILAPEEYRWVLQKLAARSEL